MTPRCRKSSRHPRRTLGALGEREEEILEQIGESNEVFGNYFNIEGTCTYIATMNGFRAVEISDPQSPQIIGSIDFGNAFEIEIHNGFAYLQAGIIVIIDLSEKGNYKIDARYSPPTQLSEMKGRDNYLFATAVTKGMIILNVVNPVQPVIYSEFNDNGYYANLDLKDNVVFLGDYENGLEIIDIADLSSPRKISTF